MTPVKGDVTQINTAGEVLPDDDDFSGAFAEATGVKK